MVPCRSKQTRQNDRDGDVNRREDHRRDRCYGDREGGDEEHVRALGETLEPISIEKIGQRDPRVRVVHHGDS